MIGSVSSASFASFGYSNHSQGDRFASARHPEADPKAADELKSAKDKEDEEKAKNPNHLDEDEKQQVAKLKQRDAEVRAHEQAHMAAAGSLAMGGPNYVFQTGPDGKQYAIGGNVKIDTSPAHTPEQTAQKAKQIRAAALAPSDPSPQDLKVAASAASMEMEASAKLNDKNSKKADNGLAPSFSENGPTGEITSASQVFATSPGDPQDHEGKNGDQTRQTVYMIQVAKLYKS